MGKNGRMENDPGTEKNKEFVDYKEKPVMEKAQKNSQCICMNDSNLIQVPGGLVKNVCPIGAWPRGGLGKHAAVNLDMGCEK